MNATISTTTWKKNKQMFFVNIVFLACVYIFVMISINHVLFYRTCVYRLNVKSTFHRFDFRIPVIGNSNWMFCFVIVGPTPDWERDRKRARALERGLEILPVAHLPSPPPYFNVKTYYKMALDFFAGCVGGESCNPTANLNTARSRHTSCRIHYPKPLCVINLALYL